jgi:hypothetical protein
LFFLQGITESKIRVFLLGREELNRIVDERKSERGH